MARRIFVFNGDADGLCALQQLLLHEGRGDDLLLTGPKRKTALVQEVNAAHGDTVTVLDLSLLANRAAVDRLLTSGVRLRYFDHHEPGELPFHPQFDSHIDMSPAVCTSVIVDRYLEGANRAWAVVGAFGDNLDDTARALADDLGLGDDRDRLRQLGISLNYNSYGEREEDLFFSPKELHGRLIEHKEPMAFIAEDPAFKTLWDGFQDDLSHASALDPVAAGERACVYSLPDTAWARRVSGVFANQCAHKAPAVAHAILSPNSAGGMTVSVRAPLNRPTGASDFCRQFPGGGGRSGAAGVNHLPLVDVDYFVDRFLRTFATG
jgi:hypothetical protein